MSDKITIKWTSTGDYEAMLSREDLAEFINEAGALDWGRNIDSFLAELEGGDVELSEGSFAVPGNFFEREVTRVRGIKEVW